MEEYDIHELKLSQKQSNQLKQIQTKTTKNLFREKDKSDNQTIDQVLDARISRIISKFKKSGLIKEFNGCISTGKEANVYYARGSGTLDSDDLNKEIAVKIYKTSILIFKDRERYITGEFRWRHGYCKSNPRKMVSLWAEKEIRNLKRLKQKGIKCPIPYNFKSNLIMMEFIGKDGKAAPRLKDAIEEIENIEEFDNIYLQILKIMKIMYHDCKLIHSDFSEYNLLYFNKEIYVIDVAQSVELQHVNADYFLKRDCHNINEFFSKNKIMVISDQQFYDAIVKNDIKINDLEDYIDLKRGENIEKIREDEKYLQKENDLFCKFEVPFDLVKEGIDLLSPFLDLDIAMKNLVKKFNEKELREAEGIFSDEEEDEEEEDEEEEEEEEEKEKKKKFDPFEGMSKKERKEKVKKDKKEKRENKKFSKKEKKKIIKRTKANQKQKH